MVTSRVPKGPTPQPLDRAQQGEISLIGARSGDEDVKGVSGNEDGIGVDVVELNTIPGRPKM